MKLKLLHELKRERARPITWDFVQQTAKELEKEFKEAGYHTGISIKRLIMHPAHSWAQVRITNEEWTYDGQYMVTINLAVKGWPSISAELFKWYEGQEDYQDEGIDVNLSDEDAMDEIWEFVREHLPL
jgi:hypothetical protein